MCEVFVLCENLESCLGNWNEIREVLGFVCLLVIGKINFLEIVL